MCQPTGKLQWDRQAVVGQWASYRNKGCVDGHCVQLGAIAWGWPPAWQTSAASAATSSCCSVAFSALCAAAAACSAAAVKFTADRTRWAARSASLALLRGPSTCRRLSLTPATLMLSSFQMRAVLRVDQLEQFLRALSIRSAVQLLSTRVRWSSRAHQRRGAHTRLACIQALLAYTPGAPALMTTSLTPSRQRTPLLGAPAALLAARVRNSCASLGSSHLEECHIYIKINRFLSRFALYKVLEALFTP